MSNFYTVTQTLLNTTADVLFEAIKICRGRYRNFEKGRALRISDEGGPSIVGGNVPENCEN